MSKNTNNNQTVDEKKGKRTGLTILDEEAAVKNHMCVSSEEQQRKGNGRQTMIRQTSQWLYGKAASGVCSFGNSVWFSDRYDFSDRIKDILENNYDAKQKMVHLLQHVILL